MRGQEMLPGALRRYHDRPALPFLIANGALAFLKSEREELTKGEGRNLIRIMPTVANRRGPLSFYVRLGLASFVHGELFVNHSFKSVLACILVAAPAFAADEGIPEKKLAELTAATVYVKVEAK